MGKKTLLLVEDDQVLNDMVKGALETEYKVLSASSYSGAMKHLNRAIDLALIDYSLPDKDGFEVLERVREAKPGLPVIVMTAYSCENLAIRAIQAGVTDYLKKPLSFAYLRGKLSEILAGKERDGQPESVENREVLIMDDVAAFIEENYAEKLTLDRVAARGGMNRFRFCRSFKERFGMNYTGYLNNVRTRNAARLIKNSDMKITVIAHLVGYNCITYFERVFKTRYGVPPIVYRRRLKENTT